MSPIEQEEQHLEEAIRHLARGEELVYFMQQRVEQLRIEGEPK